MTDKMRIAVGVSGGGRSLANLIERQGHLPFEIGLVFSSAEDIGANSVARDAGLPLVVLDFSRKNQAIAREHLYAALLQHQIHLVVLAGFLKLLPVDNTWAGKIINIHPALLPKFGGKGMHGHYVHEAVMAAKETSSGATVHFVNERYDEGALIAQSRVVINAGESAADLADHVFASECELLPWAIGELATGGLPKNRIVIFDKSGVVR